MSKPLKVIIDPGHAPGNVNGGGRGYKEFAGMWKLSNFLKTALERYNISVELTRTENADPSLTERGKKAAGCALFISEHSNAANRAARGVECYYSVKIPGDKTVAAALSKEVAAFMNNPNRGSMTRASTNGSGDYYTVMAAAVRAGAKHVFLIENGFHDNEYDEMVLLKDENLANMAAIQARIIATFLGASLTAAPAPEDNTGLTLITGNPVASVAQMRAYIAALNPAAPDIADIFIDEGIAEGIRGDVAFAQACIETGNFTYAGSAVKPEQHNYCGMGVTGAGAKGNSFATEAEGVRAQIQHLKAYANTAPLNKIVVDPRFQYVERGVSPYVEYLGVQENPKGKGWATGANYGAKILAVLAAILKTPAHAHAVMPPAPEAESTVKFVLFGQKTVEIPGKVINNVTYVQARQLLEALEFAVTWNEQQKTVEVNIPTPAALREAFKEWGSQAAQGIAEGLK